MTATLCNVIYGGPLCVWSWLFSLRILSPICDNSPFQFEVPKTSLSSQTYVQKDQAANFTDTEAWWWKAQEARATPVQPDLTGKADFILQLTGLHYNPSNQNSGFGNMISSFRSIWNNGKRFCLKEVVAERKSQTALTISKQRRKICLSWTRIRHREVKTKSNFRWKAGTTLGKTTLQYNADYLKTFQANLLWRRNFMQDWISWFASV